MHKSCSSCGHQQSDSFSMIFTMPNYDQHICPYAAASSPSSVVDCTLSLATPSSRLPSLHYDDSRFCWDFLHPPPPPPPSHKTIGAPNPSATVDSLLARRCANCDTTSTPLWRNGPRGPKSLCNACGIRFKKEERRLNAGAPPTTAVGGGMDGRDGHTGSTWMHNAQAAAGAVHKLPSCYAPAATGGELRFRDDVDDRDSTFMSWRHNVTDRAAGLVHDFTRY